MNASLVSNVGSSMKARLLLVEDSSALAELYQIYLETEPFSVTHVESGQAALSFLEREPPDILLLDLKLPDMDGFEVLNHIRSHEILTAPIVITAHGSVNIAVECMRAGARDFIVKPFTAERLKITLQNVYENWQLKQMVEKFCDDYDRTTYCGFIGNSLCMQAVYRIIDSAATSKATVFITGESGTGKEVCAEAIHRQSPRAANAFVALNCAAIPRDLIESEIFGHTKGAFTGAIADRDGAAQRADGGTLFLDELCEMDLDLQAKLLRFVQTGIIRKVGGSRDVAVDVRIVCATNRDPLAEVAAGRFREDLYYRLHVIPIELPPLRDRDDDVVRIAEKFLTSMAQEEEKNFTNFDQAVNMLLLDHNWPGNVRELQNLVRNIVVLNEGEQVTMAMLPASFHARRARDGGAGQKKPATSMIVNPSKEVLKDMTETETIHYSPSATAPSLILPKIEPLHVTERRVIEKVLDIFEGNIPKAAAALEISASTIYRKKSAWEAH